MWSVLCILCGNRYTHILTVVDELQYNPFKNCCVYLYVIEEIFGKNCIVWITKRDVERNAHTHTPEYTPKSHRKMSISPLSNDQDFNTKFTGFESNAKVISFCFSFTHFSSRIYMTGAAGISMKSENKNVHCFYIHFNFFSIVMWWLYCHIWLFGCDERTQIVDHIANIFDGCFFLFFFFVLIFIKINCFINLSIVVSCCMQKHIRSPCGWTFCYARFANEFYRGLL